VVILLAPAVNVPTSPTANVPTSPTANVPAPPTANVAASPAVNVSQPPVVNVSEPPAVSVPEPPAPGRQSFAAALVDRLKQAAALTPAEARRLEKIKTALGYVPEVWLATHVAQWMKSLPEGDIDRARTVDGQKSGIADSP
jgi:hypothetical protein